jgi:hypothetical protein
MDSELMNCRFLERVTFYVDEREEGNGWDKKRRRKMKRMEKKVGWNKKIQKGKVVIEGW